MSVDKIVVKGVGVLTPDKWKALPMPQRIGYVSRNEVQFFAGSQEVPAREAVAALR
jgi:hypothetical protein